ncbi:MAG TPA: type I polyketide synthase, partial [Ignavibacteriaceae bacterium]|nr:type I polyketide synthase [Ignavibacteriaceae bacterium]
AEIGYIETHGSGTPVGDPIEIAALTKAFKRFTNKKNYCAIGSVKTNIGHLDAAAGIAGIIKTILCLINKKIPPSLNFDTSNPEIDFKNSPFYVNVSLKEWYSSEKRNAGIMSTGMGGTNSYIILQEAPNIPETKTEQPSLVLLSAKNEKALDEQTIQLLEHFKTNETIDLRNTAYTLQVGRKEFDYRRFFIARNNREAIEFLNQKNSKRIYSDRIHNSSKRPVIFLFPGVGDQYAGMGYDLYNNLKVFRETVDYCAEVVFQYIGTDIRDILYPEDCKKKAPENTQGIDLKKMLADRTDITDINTNKLNQTLYAQPALFIVEYALAKLWIHLGITPDAIIGHSMGEYVAACLAGVFSLEDALKLIAKRAQLVNNLPEGSMLAVALPEKDLLPLLNDDISISLINSPGLCIIAGTENNVSLFKELLNRKEIFYRPVRNAHAFHSKMMSSVFDDFVRVVSQVKLNSPEIPYTSNITGEWISENEAVNPEYWAKHLIGTARFSNSMEKALQINNSVLLEIGPGNTLGVLAMQHPAGRQNGSIAISTLRPEYNYQSDINFLLTNIGKLWLSGIHIDWEKLYEEDNLPRRVPLPAYPFQYENYWLKSAGKFGNNYPELKEQRNSFKDWFYVPGWTRKSFYNKNVLSFEGKKLWIIFLDEKGLGIQLKKFLEDNKQTVITVKFGNKYYKNKDDYLIDIRHPSDYINLFRDLKSIDSEILNIIHLGCYSEKDNSWFDHKNDTIQYLGFYSLLYITQSLSRLNFSIPVNIEIISSHIHQVTGDEILCPKKGLIIGPCGVIPKEFPGINSFNVDLILEDLNDENREIVKNLISEFDDAGIGSLIAYRGKFKWIKRYD